MRALPRSAQIYIATILSLALVAFIAAFFSVVTRPELIPIAIVLTVLIALFDLYPVILNDHQVEILLSTAIKISSLLLFDPSIVIVSTFLGSLLSEARFKRAFYKKIFNVSLMTTTYTVMAFVYMTAQGDGVSIVETPRSLFALTTLAFSDVVVNSLILSVAIALATGSSVGYIWSKNSKPIIIHDLSMVPIGAFIAMLWRVSPIAVLLATVPLFLVRYSYQLVEHLRRQTRDALMVLARMLDERDEGTHRHCEMVSNHAEEVARELGLAQGEVETIKLAAFLHDIGKIGMSNSILYKPGALTPEERELAKKHAAWGGDLLKQFPLFEKGALYVRHHHERWDGQGYPDGLKGEDIPIGARILSVSDSFQAMVEDRPYRSGLPLATALHEIFANSGTQFDPNVVRALFQAKGQAYPKEDTVQSEPPSPTTRITYIEPEKRVDPKLIKPQVAS